eukprot:PhM_4_TR5151/c0_g1_i1/m.23043
MKLSSRLLAESSRRTILFTPGPLTTTDRVKAAMTADYGSRDTVFVNTVKEVRSGLLEVAKADPALFSAIPMQGSGTMGIEAVIGSTTPHSKKGKYMVIRNGSYGARMLAICERLKIPVVDVPFEEGQEIDVKKVESLIKANKDITNVGIVHCETSTGMFNPIHEVGDLVRSKLPEATYIVDAMSSFGGVDFAVPDVKCDYIISSSNKCIQGVPGFSIIVARKEHEKKVAGLARSYTMDIWNQSNGLDKTGQFNNTPPVHVIMAFNEALKELKEEGGVAARQARYKMNTQRTLSGLGKLGFRPFLDPSRASFGHIITGYHYPVDPKWDFTAFYEALSAEKCVIYPGKTGKADCFRIGSIGDIHPGDVEYLLVCVKKVMSNMGLTFHLPKE